MNDRNDTRLRRSSRTRTTTIPCMILPLLVILMTCTAPLFARGQQELVQESGSQHDPHQEGVALEEILPVTIPAGSRLKVIATTSILGDVVKAVADGVADITVLMPPGQNPHSFEPAPGDLLTIQAADIILINGLGLEENLLDDIESTASGPIISVSADIVPLTPTLDEHEEEGEHGDEHRDEDQHDHGEFDPHVWMDPHNVVLWVERIVAALSAADPAHMADYRRKGDSYIEELQQMDAQIRASLRSIPEASRKLVVDHSSFTYFAETYGFDLIGAIIPGVSDTREPSARDIATLVDLIRSSGVRAIFVAQTASRGLQTLAKSVAGEVGSDVVILPTLTGALSTTGQRGDSYIDLLRFNVEQIVKGLGGAPTP